MKEMIKRVRGEKGGFTLAELLIVVAIILVLVAIAVPVFTGAQDTANAATREANIRTAKSTSMVYILENYSDTSKVPAITDSNKVYEVKGKVEKDGSITISGVSVVATAGTDTLGGNDTKATTGDFAVYLKDTDIKTTTPPSGK